MKWDLLEHILYVSRRMAETRNLTLLLNYVVDEAIKLVGAERGYIVLLQSEGTLDFRVTRDQNGKNIAHAEDQVSKSILTDVITTKRPLVLDNAMTNPQFSRSQSVAILKLRSIMCVPLISRGETIGAVYVENRSREACFSQEELPPLTLFANQAAVAIENAMLIEDLEARVAARTQELEQAMLHVETGWHEAVEANRLRTVWLSKIAHDLKAPLAIAAGSLSLLEEGEFGPLNDEQLKWVDKSLKTVQHATNLINQISDLSSLEVGGITLQFEMVSLKEFLKNTYEIAQGLAWSKAVTFRLDMPSSLPLITIDPVRIRQVLLNLISNAHKFTTKGTVTLYAQSIADQEEILLGVKDTGEGIPKDKAGQLFQRFQQFDNNPERRRQGTGLGLAICRELVEMHSGRIWVESTPKQGSNFIFSLPLLTEDPPAENLLPNPLNLKNLQM